METTKQKVERLADSGLKRVEIADICGVSRQRVQQILGKRDPAYFRPFGKERCVYVNLRDWLNQERVSINELVRRLDGDMNPRRCCAVSAWLTGKTYPLKSSIDKLIAVTGLSYEELFEVD